MVVKKADIKKMSVQEMQDLVPVLRQELFKLRLSAASSPLKDPTLIRKTRRALAQCLTYVQQKNVQG